MYTKGFNKNIYFSTFWNYCVSEIILFDSLVDSIEKESHTVAQAGSKYTTILPPLTSESCVTMWFLSYPN